MENFMQDLDIPNSESNTETEFSRQVEECQSNLNRMEKLFFDLQKDSQKMLGKTPDSVTKSLNFDKKKLSNNCLDNQTMLQEVYDKTYSKDDLHSNNNIKLPQNTVITGKEDVTNNYIPPFTFIVQVPNSIVEDVKKNISSADFLNLLSQCSSKQNFKVQKKKGISSLFQSLFKKKKNNMPPCLDALLLKNMKFMKFSAKTDQNHTKSFQNLSEYNKNQTSANTNSFSTETATNVNMNNTNTDITEDNSHREQTLIFPINFNSDMKIHETDKPNVIIQHEIKPKNNLNLYSHTIKITNEIPTDCYSQSSKIIEDKVNSKEKETETLNSDKLKSENSLVKSLIENLLESTKNLNNLEILKIFVEILHEEKLKKKSPHCIDCFSTKINNNKESNFLQIFLQRLMVDLQNKTKLVEKNRQQMLKRQSSKISICSTCGGISSEEEYFGNSVILKSKRMHKSRRCQSPSMLKYRFCQSEKDIDKKENVNK